jgi:hypothetical protein
MAIPLVRAGMQPVRPFGTRIQDNPLLNPVNDSEQKREHFSQIEKVFAIEACEEARS